MKRDKGIINKTMQNHNIVFLLVSMLVIAGIYGLIYMNKDEYPQFTIRQGLVVGVYPGANSVEITEQLTKPLENYLFTYPEVDKTLTYSYSQDGMVYVFVELNKNVHNKNEAWSKIRHGLKDFKMQLPSGVLALVVVDDFGNTSSMLLTLESTDKSQRELQTYMATLCDRLRTIPAMGNLRTLGTQNEEISIYIEPEKLAMYGINSKTLLANLYTQGFLTVSGNISTDYFNQPIHIESPLQSEQEIAEQIIYTDPEGNTIRMRDVARIERRYSVPTDYINNNGNRAILLSMEMRPGNNIVAFGESVNEIMDEFQQELPPSVKLSRISNQPKVVGDSVWSFLRDLVTSMVIVIAVMLMLFPLRSALVAGTSIPICTGISLAVMFVFNIELNTVTLAALITVLGMMVDNSIVMIDGYIERIERGTSRWHSAIASTKELFPPLLLATVAISGMFFPVKYILTGPMQDFVKLFPWTIAISLLISLVYAALVVPYLEFSFIKPSKSNKKPNIAIRIQNKFFYWLQSGYEWLLRLCFHHPYLTMLTAIGTTLVGLAMFLSLNVQMMPMADRPCFAVEITLPMGSTLEQTAAVSDSLQKILQADERITSVTAFVGNSSPRFQATYAPNIPGSHFAQFIVNTESNSATEDILRDYAHYANYFPNAYVRFKQIDYQAVPNPIEVRFTGEDREALQAQADKLMAYMRTLPDKMQWVHSDCDGTLPCINIELRPDEATRLGITKSMLSMHLATALDGQPLTTIWEGDYAVPVKLYTTDTEVKMDYQGLENLLVPTAFGTWVPLRQVAVLSPGWQPARIVHRNGVPCITVGADLVRGVSQPVAMKEVKRFVEGELIPNLPEGVEVAYGGLTETNKGLIPELAWGVVLAIVVIFLFLIFNFGKIDIAVLSLAACMLCFFGAFFGLWLFRLDFSITAVLGIVSLIGIIVRNGIIMFEHAEDLRVNQHKTAYEAGFDAGKRRMRPIFLTSATTALGVLPMIISGTSLWMPMGVVICFGTIFSLVLIVTILPVAYWLIYKKKDGKKQLKKA